MTAAFLAPGDDPANIAHLVASLRCGYGHSRLDTTLPAPLFFETKARDYMARFTIDELDAEDDEAALPSAEPPPEAEGGAKGGGEAAGEDADTSPTEDELLDAAAAESAAHAVVAAVAVRASEGDGNPAIRAPEAAVPPTLLPPWSRLLRPSLAVSLVDSTSLSTSQTMGAGLVHGAVRFGIPSNPPGMSATGVLGMVDARKAAARESEAGVDEEMTGGNENDGDDHDGGENDTWLEAARLATVPVPTFADAAWMLSVTSLPGNNFVLRNMQPNRAAIGKVSGYAWPEQRPVGRDAVAEALVKSLVHPLGFRVAMDVAYLSLDRNRRKRFRPYSILHNRVQPWRWAADPGKTGRRAGMRTKARRPPEIAVLLEEHGHHQDALSVAYLEVLWRGWTREMADIVAACHLHELDAFMEAMAKLAEGRKGKDTLFTTVWMAMFSKAPTKGDLPPGHEDGPDMDAEDTEDEAAGSHDEDEAGTPAPKAVGQTGGEHATGDAGASGQENNAAGGFVAEQMPETGAGDATNETPLRETLGHAAAASATSPAKLTAKRVDDVAPAGTADPAGAALEAWSGAMALLARAASQAAGQEPDAELLRTVMGPVQDARAALEAWIAAQPKLFDAAPLVLRGRCVIDGLAALARPPGFNLPTGLHDLSGRIMVEPGIFEEAGALIAEAEANLARAQEAAANFKAILSDQSRIYELWDEANASKETASKAMHAAGTRLDAAGAILVAGAQAAAPAPRAAAPDDAASVASGAVSTTLDQHVGIGESTPIATPVEAEARPQAPAVTVVPDSLPTLEPVLTRGPVPLAVAEDDGARDDLLDDPGPEAIDEAEAAEPALAPGEPGPADEPFERHLDSGTAAGVEDIKAAEEPVLAEPDPVKDEVAHKLMAFVSAQAFGSAYHLRRAAEAVFPGMDDVPFSAAELRLAAMAGHIGHVAMQGSTLLERIIQAAVTAVTDQLGHDEPLLARRIILTAACAELAMFHPSLPAPFGMGAIEETTPELSEAFRGLRAAVTEGARFGSITPALLRTVGEEMADDRYVESCRQAVLDNIAGFSKMHFNWAPANRIRANLHMRNGVLGEYRVRIEAGEIEAARAFASEFRSRNAVMDLAEKIDASLTVKPKPLDGAARERLLSAFDDLVALSAEYVDASDALNSARTSHHKGAVQRIAQAVIAGADQAIRTVEMFASEAGPLLAAACSFTIRALTRLRDAASGRFAPVGIHDHQLAVHGPLLWLPNMHYGPSWLPSPYRPEGIVNAMRAAPPVTAAPGDDAFRDAIRARVKEGSYIAARMLIQAGGFYGIDDATRAQMANHCDANLLEWRTSLKDDLDDTRRMIDKVQRMGSLVRIDQASAFAVLDRITPDTLPAEVSLEARTEEIEPEQILDFGSARDQIQDVRDRVSSLLTPLRRSLLDRLGNLTATAAKGDVARVRKLIEGHDDLVTAGEYVEFLEEGNGLPERAGGNRRVHAFFPAVPEALVKLGKGSLDEVKRAIETGTDLPGLPYSRIPAPSRSEAVERLDVWRDLRRRVERGDQAQMVQPLLDRLFTAARMSPVVLSPASNGPKLPPKTYVAEMRLSLPEDKASLLLPDFGSLVGFNYRIAVAPRLPSEAEMAELCRDAGTYGTMVVVTSVVDAERRRQLQGSCLAQNRRVLVLDEAILLFALSEAEFRPLTLIECAQPFSFAAPYKDYGNSPVPPEMFFGRETEIRKIVDRMGSCIVYGGRRLGKTALLRHIRAQYSDAGEGGSTAVGYANIRDVGAVQNRIWDAASRDLPGIFPTPVRTAAEFRARIEKWLEEDNKRRILLLLDEADQFIEGDAKQQFTDFTALQSLMDNSFRRFKVVLAGLHNVTRIVRTENSPLKQIASDPQRIGPLMDKELPDAERLVTRPLSALGYEFKNRSDVWRILSHCNYYPVLVQTFCAGLLESLTEATVRRPRGIGEITDRQVRDALENEGIRREIEAKFGYTIREIDPRYELITCVVAEKVMQDTEAGRPDEGMTAVEVLDGAATWWPVAFEHPNALETVKDLLDEMVGLGVLRQTPTGAWALRSHAILRLLGDNDHVATGLLSFEKRPAPPAFDPRSMRRSIVTKEEPSYPCPLTWGQEHDLAAGQSSISVVFGSVLSDVGLVGGAVRGTEALRSNEVAGEGGKPSIVLRSFSELASFTEMLRSLARTGAPTLLVVDLRSQWDVTWIEAAMKQKVVKQRVVRLIFVGGPEHALCWARNPRSARLPGVQVVPLQPWADAYLGHRLGEGNLPAERFAQEIRRITGGYNRLMASVFSGFSGHNIDRFAKHLDREGKRIAKSSDLLAEAGLLPPLTDLFGLLSEWADDNGRIGMEEIRLGAEDGPGEPVMTAAQAIQYGVAIGLLEPLAARPGEDPERRAYAITPMVLSALRQRQTQLEVA